MLTKASVHWAAPLGAMFSLMPPFCSHWPDRDPGGGHGHAGSAHAGSGADAGAAGAGGAASADLPVIGCPPGPWPETPQLQLLEDSGALSVRLVSGDGEVSVGFGEHGPLFWSGDDVTEVELAFASNERAVTCDGSIVIGNINDTNVAFRVLRSGTFTYLDTPNNGEVWTSEDDISESGVALGAHRVPLPEQPLLWDASGAVTELPALRGLDTRRISPDGKTIWGVTHDCNEGCTTDAIFRYSAAEGITRYPIGGIPGFFQMANDGSALFELGMENGVTLPYDAVRPLYRFDSSTGSISSFECPATTRCWPVAASSRAAVVFFNSARPSGEPFVDSWVWDEAHGSRPIPQLLAELGISEAGDFAPSGVSDDARVLTGEVFRGFDRPFVPFRLLAPRGTFY
ncbi:MAG: hypothetical protein EOO73_25635 [Myxococcales bacterium]|nr:MAG: hypothetical protein EOO73_25635 [Myxococcales bacterium]